MWNNDGSLLAFNAIINGKWNVVLADKNKVIRTLAPDIESSSISWTPANEIVTHNLTSLFLIDTSGVVKQTTPITELIKSPGVSSFIKFTFTNDNRNLIFNASNSEAWHCNGRPFHDENPYAIFNYDLIEKRLTKLTPDSLSCGDYTIMGDSIYFAASETCAERENHIYIMSLKGEGRRLFLKDVDELSLPNIPR